MAFPWPTGTHPVQLSPGGVDLWAAEIDDPGCPPARLWAVLAKDECDRANRFRFDQPRDRYVAARYALRNILSGYLQIDPAAISFTYDTLGKPSLDVTAHEDRLTFNVAHSAGVAVFAVTRRCEVGIDVECVRSVRHAVGIADRFFHVNEALAVKSGPDFDLDWRFFRCWTRKEAVVKTVGAGLQFPLGEFQVPVTHDEPRWIDLPQTRTTPATRCWLQTFQPCVGFIGAVATLQCQRECTFQSFVF